MAALQVNINPYEGKPRGWLVISIAALVLVTVISVPTGIKVAAYAVFGLLLIVTGLSVLGRAIMLSKGHWARLHYPLMVRYAAVTGGLAAVPAGASVDDMLFRKQPNYAPQKMLRTIVNDNDAGELIKNIENRAATDKKAIKAYMTDVNPGITDAQLKKVLAEAKEILSYKNPRTYIAELVAAVYGEQERDKYVIAVLTGKAD